MESTKHEKTPAPYGQACAHCVRAKSRCMLLEGGTCERLVRRLHSSMFDSRILNVYDRVSQAALPK
jgi:hypothetical protein